ncbi:allophanate hydrolase [Streptomyces peucetius subsp. caesius ATCC 27952]|nr:allophanate hydrolase [Streptomyces peucetius subsp. caesius ATCC 27952]
MRLRPVGEDSLLIDLDTPEEAQAWYTRILSRRDAGTLMPVRDIVPGDRTVLLYGVAVADAAAELQQWSVPPSAAGSGPLIEIPVHYDGADLRAVAGLWGVTEDEVARIHSGTEHRVAFCGFSPGFAYMLGLGEKVPRCPAVRHPRTSVPAESVALAGPYTGVYPRASPGGWQLIGTTRMPLWDLEREPAALLTPGTRVRFVPQEASLESTSATTTGTATKGRKA